MAIVNFRLFFGKSSTIVLWIYWKFLLNVYVYVLYFLANWKNMPLILYSCNQFFVSGFKSDTRYKYITVSSMMKSLYMKRILFVLFNNRYFIRLYIRTHRTFVIMKSYHCYILNMENSNNRNYYRWIPRNLIIFNFYMNIIGKK